MRLLDETETVVTDDHIRTALDTDEPERLLAHLLLDGVVFLNTHWREESWPAEARTGIVILVLCNDQFGPGSDAERIQLDEIKILYRMWMRDPMFGPLAWVIAKRKQPPWPRRKTEERMMGVGWDVDALVRGELPAALDTLQ